MQGEQGIPLVSLKALSLSVMHDHTLGACSTLSSSYFSCFMSFLTVLSLLASKNSQILWLDTLYKR